MINIGQGRSCSDSTIRGYIHPRLEWSRVQFDPVMDGTIRSRSMHAPWNAGEDAVQGSRKHDRSTRPIDAMTHGHHRRRPGAVCIYDARRMKKTICRRENVDVHPWGCEFCDDSRSESGMRGPTTQSSMASHSSQLRSPAAISASDGLWRVRNHGTDSSGDMS